MLNVLGTCSWICENFQGPDFPDLHYSSMQDKQQVDKLIHGCASFTSAGLDLLAGRTGRSLQSSICTWLFLAVD